MRYPNQEPHCRNIAFKTLPEVFHALNLEVDRLTYQVGLRARTEQGRRKLEKTHLINAIAMWFLGLTAEERDRIVRSGLEAFEALQASDVPTFSLGTPGSIGTAVPPVKRRRKGRPGHSAGRNQLAQRQDAARTADYRPVV